MSKPIRVAIGIAAAAIVLIAGLMYYFSLSMPHERAAPAAAPTQPQEQILRRPPAQ